MLARCLLVHGDGSLCVDCFSAGVRFVSLLPGCVAGEGLLCTSCVEVVECRVSLAWLADFWGCCPLWLLVGLVRSGLLVLVRLGSLDVAPRRTVCHVFFGCLLWSAPCGVVWGLLVYWGLVSGGTFSLPAWGPVAVPVSGLATGLVGGVCSRRRLGFMWVLALLLYLVASSRLGHTLLVSFGLLIPCRPCQGSWWWACVGGR